MSKKIYIALPQYTSKKDYDFSLIIQTLKLNKVLSNEDVILLDGYNNYARKFANYHDNFMIICTLAENKLSFWQNKKDKNIKFKYLKCKNSEITAKKSLDWLVMYSDVVIITLNLNKNNIDSINKFSKKQIDTSLLIKEK